MSESLIAMQNLMNRQEHNMVMNAAIQTKAAASKMHIDTMNSVSAGRMDSAANTQKKINEESKKVEY